MAGAFSLVSFDYSCGGGLCGFSVSGTVITGGSTSVDDFTTSFAPGFPDLTTLVFTSVGDFHRIDKIVLTYEDVAPIPLPAGLPLLLGGLAGLGLMARRKRLAA